jgi:molybdopterin-biosynthesis enzyme MoeA-like protein
MDPIKPYALIIGTEILNRRRVDKHFSFLCEALDAYGYRLCGSLVIEDDPKLITETLRLLASQKSSMVFCFGGIGSTPDDYTRQCAADALRDGTLYPHLEAQQTIEAQLGKRAYPYAIRMADLPKGAELLHNTVNNIPAFSLDQRFFFMPGFPQMSHPMVTQILKSHLAKQKTLHRFTLTAACRESFLIPIMEQLPPTVELSSLPKIKKEGYAVTLSVASRHHGEAQAAFNQFITLLERKNIPYTLDDDPND